MANIEIGTRLQSNITNDILKILDINKKFKTVLLQSEKNGITYSYSLSTLKDKNVWRVIDSPMSMYEAEKLINTV